MNLSIWNRVFRAKFGLALSTCIFLEAVLIAPIMSLLPILLSTKIGLDKTQITALFLINTLVGIGVILVTGYLSDGTVARYKLVLVSGGIATLGYLGLATITQPYLAFIAGPMTIALSVLFPQLFAVAKAGIVATWEREAQTTGITALRTVFSFGFILGTALASWLARVMDIQLVFFLIAFALIGLTVMATIVLYQIERAIVRLPMNLAEVVGGAAQSSSRAPFPWYALLIPLSALIVLQGADSTRMVYLPLVMFQLFHNASVAPLMFGITAAAELVTMPVLGYLSAKTGEKAAIILGALVGALYFATLSFAQSQPVLYVAHLGYAIFNAALLGVAMAYVQQLLANRAGMGSSLYLAVLNIGSLVGILSPLLVTGYDQKIFIIPAILCIAGATLLMVGDRTALYYTPKTGQ